jgi:hypothetical protein
LKKTTEKPFANSRLARYVTERLGRLEASKTQREIAVEVGYDRPNIVSMIKAGNMKMPLDKVPAFAKALGVDVAILMRLAFEQHRDDKTANDPVLRMFTNILSDEELAIVTALRAVERGEAPKVSEDQLRIVQRLVGMA